MTRKSNQSKSRGAKASSARGQRTLRQDLKPARRAVPFPFVLDALDSVPYHTRPMFGCLAIYVDEKIVLALRDKQPADSDVGVWIATTPEHHESLKRDFPSMRSIEIFGTGVTGWQVLPASDIRFEDEALRVAEYVRRRDERIGKLPAKKKKKASQKAKRVVSKKS